MFELSASNNWTHINNTQLLQDIILIKMYICAEYFFWKYSMLDTYTNVEVCILIQSDDSHIIGGYFVNVVKFCTAGL